MAEVSISYQQAVMADSWPVTVGDGDTLRIVDIPGRAALTLRVQHWVPASETPRRVSPKKRTSQAQAKVSE